MAEAKPKVAKPAIGIDLGTTYSCVAVFQNGKPEVIANSQGDRITPSVVAFTEKGRVIGEGAEIQKKLDPSNTIYNAKRFIGRTFEDPIVKKNISSYPFQVEEKDDNKIQFPVICASNPIKVIPEEVSAAILGRMKKIAESFLDETVEDAVITVPAYFTDSQRQATKDAGKIAGLNVTRIINEPTAAAMAYGLTEEMQECEGKHVLVYDLGGGTFDVSILELLEDGLFEVKATAGNTNLGGEDINTLLVKHFKKEIFRKYNFDITSNHKAVNRLRGACETLKRNLSADNTTESKIQLDSFLPNEGNFISSMSRAKFENICKDLINETIKEVEKVLQDSMLTKDMIDEVILVGGSTRIPKIQSKLSKFFNHKILNKSINPDESVACGAAVQAAILNNDQHVSVRDTLLMDVIPLSIGCNVIGGVTDIIVDRNTVIPVRINCDLMTTRNNQEGVTFRITEGERTLTKNNNILGTLSIDGLPRGRAGSVGFETVFDIDANGILTVSATVKGTDKQASKTLDSKLSGKLSKEEIDKLIEEAEKMKICDEAEENRVGAMNKLISLCDHIHYEIQGVSRIKLRSILKDTEMILSWINDNPNAPKCDYASRYDNLMCKATPILENSAHEYTHISSHLSRMDNMTSSSYMEQGKELLESGTTDDIIKASKCFNAAYKVGQSEGNRTKEINALWYYGHSHKLLSNIVTDTNEKMDHAISTVRILSFVMFLETRSLSANCLGEDRRRDVMKDIQFGADIFFEKLYEYQGQEKLDFLDKFMHAFDKSNSVKNNEFRQMVFKFLLNEINIVLEQISTCLFEGHVNSAQNYLGDLNYPKEQAKLFANSIEDKENLRKLIWTMEDHNIHALGLNQIRQAKELIDGVKEDDIDAIDKSLTALDLLNEAKLKTKDIQENVYILATFWEGKIFLTLIMNKAKAKSCFEEVIQLSEKNNTQIKEYVEARLLDKQLQKEAEEKNKPSANKETILKELEPDLKRIKDADQNMSDENFIDFLFSNYPPKHNSRYEKPEINAKNPKNKAYIRMSKFYHPDKVDVSIHGEKYKICCEEISKLVNGRYSTMKGNKR